MIDSHVHFGQFKEKYYDFDIVFDTIFDSGRIDEIICSSTSSCIPNVKYDFVRKEIEAVLKKYPSDTVTPLFWVVPDYAIKQDVKIETAMNELKYGGFKLHPFGNEWNFENEIRQYEVLHGIFDYSEKHKKCILIHTGRSGVDRPSRFEPFFSEYKNAMIILAHCCPADETIRIMQKYSNIFGDTAFISQSRIDEIKVANLGNRLLFGTDFPVTHYYYGENYGISLKDQYQKDIDDGVCWGCH